MILTNDSDKPNQNTPQMLQIAPRVGNMQIRWVQFQGVVMPAHGLVMPGSVSTAKRPASLRITNPLIADASHFPPINAKKPR